MIRRLQAADLASLAWIDSLQSPQFHWNVHQLFQLAPSHEIWGWVPSGRVLGFVAVMPLPQAWEISLLATHPDYQKQGVMRSLLRAWRMEASHQEVEVWLEVHENNGPARTLYQNLGFRLVGRRPKYYADGGAALLMTWDPIPPAFS